MSIRFFLHIVIFLPKISFSPFQSPPESIPHIWIPFLTIKTNDITNDSIIQKLFVTLRQIMSSITINIIAAVALNGAIGRGNALMWHLKGDMKFFKEKTLGSCVIMGRKTFESIGKALPGRLNIVISHSAPSLPEGVRLATSLQEAFDICREDGRKECFIIGGGQIYKEAMDLADNLLITRVFCTPNDADTFFPPIDADLWDISEESEVMKDEGGELEYRFEKFIKFNQ